jgi:hypothetical protein
MATTIFETYGVIRADGTLDLEQKLSPLPGRVKVRVELAEPAAESPEDLAKRFARLRAEWKEGVRFSSKIKTTLEHPAFQEIVAMGEKAVPLLLADLEQNGGFAFLALSRITGANPVPKDSVGKIDEIGVAWLAWGRAKGYRWEDAV